MLHVLAVCHTVLLLAGAALGVRRLAGSLGHKLAASFLLIWGNLVLTALALGVVGHLGHRREYFAASTLLSLLTAALGGFPRGSAVSPAKPLPARDGTPLRPDLLVILSGLGVLVALLASLAIAAFYYPNNFDSVAYRFPRPFLYFAQGHLGQPGPNVDFRIQHYPLNGALGYLFLVEYALDGRFFTLPSILCWSVAGLGVWLLGRDIGASRKGAFLAAALYLLSPVVLVCATSGNDEVIAATPLLLGVVFLHRWWYSASLADALLAALGLGLGAGTKLHWGFFGLYVGIVGAALLWHLVRGRGLFAFLRQRALHLALMGTLALGLCCPFLIANQRGTGYTVNPPSIMAAICNRPFRARVALINEEIYTAQLLLSPLPDLYVGTDRARVDRGYRRFNDLWARGFTWFDASDEYSSPWYSFRGLASVSEHYTEVSLWLGLTPYLLLLSLGCLFLARGRRPVLLAGWLALGFCLWHIVNAGMTRYVEGAGVYYAYPLTLSAAAIAGFWDAGKRSRLVVVAFALVLLAHGLTAVNIFGFSRYRNLPDVIAGGYRVKDAAVDAAVDQVLRSARDVEIAYAEWGLQMYDLMTRNPQAHYRAVSPSVPQGPGAVRLYCVPPDTSLGFVPLHCPSRQFPHLTLLGSMDAGGRHNVFAAGPSVPVGNDDPAGYLLLRLYPSATRSGRWCDAVSFDPVVLGMAPGERLEFKVEQRFQDGTVRLLADWQSPDRLASQGWPLEPSTDESVLRIAVRCPEDPACSSETYFPLAEGRPVDPRSPATQILTRPDRVSITNLGPLNSEGFRDIEGPYPPEMPKPVRWTTRPVARVRFLAGDWKKAILQFRAIRTTEHMVIRINGTEVSRTTGPAIWAMKEYQTDPVPLSDGQNLLEIEAEGGGTAQGDGAPLLRVLFEELRFVHAD